MDQPIPLNLVVKILKNSGTKNAGKTAFRQVIVDVGDGGNTLLKAKKGSDLYDSYGEESKLKPDTVAVLKNVESSKSSGRTLLIREPHSTIFRVVSATWEDVLAWHQAMERRRSPPKAVLIQDL